MTPSPVSRCPSAVAVAEPLASTAIALARPKSRSLTPAAVSMMLDGFTSRWTRCALWAWASASATSMPDWITSAGDSGPRVRRSSSVSPSSHSITRNGRPSIDADVEHRADVRMAQRRDRPGFRLEPRPAVGTGRDVGAKQFERDGTSEPGVARFVDMPHAAGADEGLHFVRAEHRARGQRHVASEESKRNAIGRRPFAKDSGRVAHILPTRGLESARRTPCGDW